MAILNKTDKPKIYTESDQILSNLTAELADLKSRMGQLEEEQSQNRSQLERMSIQEAVAQEVIESHEEEIQFHRENYGIIANVMNDLKTPISDVVDNLADIITEIDDCETQDALKDCMVTASSVLESFDDVKTFCVEAGKHGNNVQTQVEVRTFFRDLISGFSLNKALSEKLQFRLLIDKSVPESSTLYADTIKQSLENLVSELHHTIENGKVDIRVSTQNSVEKYGVELTDLKIEVESDIPSSIDYFSTWLETIQNNQSKLLNYGFNLLRTRDNLRKSGGSLSLSNQEHKINGFQFCIPLTY